MEKFLHNLSQIHSFSKKVIRHTLPISFLLLLIGTVVLRCYESFEQLFLARQIIETALALLMVGVGAAVSTDIYLKRNTTP